MNFFGIPMTVENPVGFYSFISIFFLLLLYLMKPKPFKKILPSLIFLESDKKRMNMASFFRKFIKDWLFFLQLLIILFLCLASLNLSAEIFTKRFSKDIVLVIDVSASSKAYDDNKMLFDKYIDIAKKNIGARNTIILIKTTPQIIAKQTNPINALRLLNSLKATDSLSNVWDAMMIAGELSNNAEILVISDFADMNNRDASIAKKLLEAKNFRVNLVNPRINDLVNVGIIKYNVIGDKVEFDIKNYDKESRQVLINDDKLVLKPSEVKQYSVNLDEGVNKIEIDTKDNFRIDDVLYVRLPEESISEVMYITNEQSNLYSAISSITTLNVKTQEPPIIKIGKENILVLDDVKYSSVLPGTLDQIKELVRKGSSLIISAQTNLDIENLQDILPVNVINEVNQDVTIFNNEIEKFSEINFGLSTKYFEATLKDNNSIVIAEANDKHNSPMIVFSKYGEGNVLYYGVFDKHNSFKISTEYPLFWIKATEILLAKQDNENTNLKIGDIIYSSSIKDPDGKKHSDYFITDKIGIYKYEGKESVVNLVNSKESDLNSGNSFEIELADTNQNIKQNFSLISLLILIGIFLAFLEIYVIKKRGDL